jgi:alcohol dehydrogenase (NADP+)
MSDYFGLLKVDGVLVAVGVPEKALTVQPFSLISMRRTYAGSMIGSIGETQEMLDFCAQHEITPEIEVIAPTDINAAWERVVRSDVRYRVVIDMNRCRCFDVRAVPGHERPRRFRRRQHH